MTDEEVFVFRKADSSEEDCARFCALFNSLYGRKVDSNYYRWQFFETPFPSVLSFAFDIEGGFAGCYGFQAIPTDSGVSIARALDIMIAPEYQGKGLFRKLAAFAENCAREFSPVALIVIANNKAEPAHTYGLGWKLTTTFKTYTAPAIAYPGHPTDARIIPFDDWTPAQEVLNFRSKRKKPLTSITRNADYLNWRFTRCPWYSYEQFAYMQHDVVRGYVVTKRFTDPVMGRTFGDIVDIAWDERDDDPARELLRYALGHFQEQGIDRAAAWLQTNTDLDRIGAGAGFVPTAHERYFCCKALDTKWTKLEENTSWYLTMADSEVY
jgi:GNAT superfamily N-acetyltransferase